MQAHPSVVLQAFVGAICSFCPCVHLINLVLTSELRRAWLLSQALWDPSKGGPGLSPSVLISTSPRETAPLALVTNELPPPCLTQGSTDQDNDWLCVVRRGRTGVGGGGRWKDREIERRGYSGSQLAGVSLLSTPVISPRQGCWVGLCWVRAKREGRE